MRNLVNLFYLIIFSLPSVGQQLNLHKEACPEFYGSAEFLYYPAAKNRFYDPSGYYYNYTYGYSDDNSNEYSLLESFGLDLKFGYILTNKLRSKFSIRAGYQYQNNLTNVGGMIVHYGYTNDPSYKYPFAKIFVGAQNVHSHLGSFGFQFEAGHRSSFLCYADFGFGGIDYDKEELENALFQEAQNPPDVLVGWTYTNSVVSTYEELAEVEYSDFIFSFDLGLGYKYAMKLGLFFQAVFHFQVYSGLPYNDFYVSNAYLNQPPIKYGLKVGVGYQFGKKKTTDYSKSKNTKNFKSYKK